MKKSFLCSMVTAAVCTFLLPVSCFAGEKLTKYGMLPIYAVDMEEGVYPVQVLSEDQDGEEIRAELTVKDGEMQAELTFSGTDVVRVFCGSAEEAWDADMSEYLEPEEGEDKSQVCTVPVPALDRELAYAIFRDSANDWVDLPMVFEASSLPKEALKITLPDYDKIEAALTAYEEAEEENAERAEAEKPFEPVSLELEDGEYAINVDLIGGSGKAYVSSPALLNIRDGKAYARLEWSSENYDYMIVGGEKYLPVNDGGNSVFEIPVALMDGDMYVIADTTAMGAPHEVNYVLNFYSDTIGPKSQMPQEAAKRVLIIALIIIVGGGILSHYSKKRY